jgi:argininosuccinate lyase
MSRTFLFVESNTTGTGAAFFRRARALRCDVVLATRDAGRYRLPDQPWLRILHVETEDLAELVAAVEHEPRVDAVWSTSDYFIDAAAEVAGALGLPGPDAGAVRSCRRKDEQAAVLQRAGVRIPRTLVCENGDTAAALAGALGYPLVVKPVVGSGSIGVRLCFSAHDLLDALPVARSPATTGRVLLQAFVPGTEYSVEVFAGRAVAIVRKHLGAPPHFVEVGHDYPVRLRASIDTSLRTTAEAAVAELGLGWGPAHVELKVGEDGTATVIEVNPRLAGGMIPVMIRDSGGPDLIGATLRACLGRPPSMGGSPTRFASIRFAIAPHAGTVRYIDATRARRQVGVRRTEVYLTAGAEVSEPTDFRSRVAHVVAVGERPAATARAAERAVAHIEVEVDGG